MSGPTITLDEESDDDAGGGGVAVVVVTLVPGGISRLRVTIILSLCLAWLYICECLMNAFARSSSASLWVAAVARSCRKSLTLIYFVC